MEREAIKNGFALLTEERRATGIFGIRDIKENTVISNLKSYLAGGFCLSDKKMKEDTDWAIQAMHIKTPSQSTQIRSLSGGNQQKIVLGKWLAIKPDVLILDEVLGLPEREIATLEELHSLLEAAENTDLIFTGIRLYPEMLEWADEVYEISVLKGSE